jgi:DNA polymerase I
LEIDRELKDMDAWVDHIIHDEVIVEAREDIAEDVKEIVKKSIKPAMGKMGLEVPFKVKAEISSKWRNSRL